VIGTVDRRRFLKRGAGIVYASAVLPSLKLWSSQIADKLKTTVPTEELVSQLKASIPQAMAKYRVPVFPSRSSEMRQWFGRKASESRVQSRKSP
jgi:hypothetical protein